jgi:hypothetical protein
LGSEEKDNLDSQISCIISYRLSEPVRRRDRPLALAASKNYHMSERYLCHIDGVMVEITPPFDLEALRGKWIFKQGDFQLPFILDDSGRLVQISLDEWIAVNKAAGAWRETA